MDRYRFLDVRNRRLTWIFIASFLLAVGVLRGERIALILSQAMLALMIVLFIYLHIIIRSLSITRSHKEKAFEDSSVLVQLTLNNSSWLPLRWLYIKDYFGPDYPSNRKREFLISRIGFFKREKNLYYMGQCRRGRGKYDVGPLELSLTDPLGIWMRQKKIADNGYILVLPQVVKLSTISAGGLSYFSGIQRIDKSGANDQFFGTREYRPGDSIRHIHWPATARLGKLIIKEFQLETTSRITIFLDLNKKTLQGFRPTTLDYSIKIAGSIAQYAVNHAKEFRLFAEGREKYSSPFAKDTARFGHLLEQMALMKPLGNKPLAEIISQYLSWIEPGEEIFVIINDSCTQTEKYANALALLKAKGVIITVVLIVSKSFETLQPHDYSNMFKEKTLLPSLLSANGIRVIPIEKNADISYCFERAM